MRASQFDRRRILQSAAQKLSKRRTFDPVNRGTPKYSPLFERAAVLSNFSVDELGIQTDQAEVDRLLDLSRPVFDGVDLRWMLGSSTRKGVLKQLNSVDRIQNTLNSIISSRSDPLLTTIGDIVAGKLTNESDDLTQLSRLWSVRELFSEKTGGMPARESIKRRIELLNFIKPFQDLAGKNFKGRVDELNRLADYVGVLDASSAYEYISRAFRQVFSLREKPPLMLFGLGGIGKSTLIARFILDHAEALNEGRLPFTYIDFDRTRFTPQQPVAILYESLHQLEIQYPDSGPTFSGLRRSWRAAVAQSTGPTKLGRIEAERQRQDIMQELLPRMIKEFAKTLEAIGLSERPYLLFLDTFEKARFPDRQCFIGFWRFVDSLQKAHPYLRLIVSGRAPVGNNPDDETDDDGGFDLKTYKLELKGLEADLAAEYLSEGGFPPQLAELAADRMNPHREGVSPLSLKVAVAVWKQRKEQGDPEILDEQFWSELQAGRIQDQLITRYLDHIEDKDVQRVAGPGLLLRVINPDIVSKVLAPSVGMVLASDEDALDLFEKLRDAIDMFTSSHEDAAVIHPRPEVRETLFELMKDLDRDKVNEVHDRAIEYYAAASDQADEQHKPRLRAEEIYHRLARGSDEQTIRARWNLSGISDALAGAEKELPVQSKAFLLSRMGDYVPGNLQNAASLATWEADARRRAKDAQSAQDKLRILREREERSPGSRLYADEANLLLDMGDLDGARAVANRGLESLPSTAASAYRVDLQITSAKIAFRLNEYDDACTLLSQAQRISIDREDARKSLEITLLKYEWGSERDDDELVAENQEKLIGAVLVMSAEQLTANADLLGRAITAIGTDEPRVILAGISGGVLEAVSDSGRRKLGRAMSAYDQEVSRARGGKPGVVAQFASIPLHRSLSDTWKGLFVDLMTLAPVVLGEVFSNFGLAHADEFLESTVSELRRAQKKPRHEEVPGSQRATSSWWSRALGSSRRLADISHTFVKLFSIEELRLLVFTVGRSIESIVSLQQPTERLVSELLRTATREGWLEDLVAKAAELRPSDGELLDIANELETGVIRFRHKELARSSQPPGRLSQLELFSRIAAVSRQVCRVEVGGQSTGTGLLVGPNLVLTSYTVLQISSDAGQAGEVQFVFDSAANRDAELGGRSFEGDGGNFIDVSGYNEDNAIDSEHLGYVLVRVDGHPGDEPVMEPGPGSPEISVSIELPRRGWIDLTGVLAKPRVDEQLLILHHPMGGPLHVAFASRGITVVEEARSRIHYRVNTQPGPAGAPCFNTNMEIIALHQGTEGHRSFGTSIRAVVQSMRQHGALAHVGVAMP